MTVGAASAINIFLKTILDPGDEILVPDPVWMNYVNVPKVLGAVPVPYLLKEENDYQMDLEEIRSKITDKTKALVMVTPNNPTGSVLSRGQIQEHVWDFSYEGASNMIDVYINNLRRKIDKGHDVKLIQTVRGMGYTIREDDRKSGTPQK